FAKWRAVITIGEDMPSSTCIDANTHALARYATLCQEAGIVPMVEPEVLMEGTILKASMVVSGKDCAEQADIEEVAESTILCLKSAVPAVLPGIVFLSGGQSDEDATAHLNAMNRLGPQPWPLSFSYGRALEQDALHLWAKE